MTNDALVRQLEYYINNGGTIQKLKSILSTSGDDNEFLKQLKEENIKGEVCISCDRYTGEENLKVCNKCAGEYKF